MTPVEQLRELRAEADTRAAALRRQADGIRGLRRENSDDDEHDPDGAPLSGELDRARAALAAAEERLNRLDAVLDRAEAGIFGRCERCGRPIGPARLRARPESALCLECAQQASTAKEPPTGRRR